MLRVILEDNALVVLDVVVQSSERNIYGRSVRLDALCTLGNGIKCNIEVQRSDNDNHLKRARFNASSITIKDSNVGDKFEDIIELYVVYISEFDFLNGNKTIYHIDASCFTMKEIKNEKFPYFSSEMNRLKTTEGGVQAVCEVMDKYNKQAIREENIKRIKKMIQRDYTKEEILELDYTEEE